MDPLNNPTPNPNPVPGASGTPAGPNPTPTSPTPVAPVTPAAPVSPAAPVPPVGPAPVAPAPSAPVIPARPAPTAPVTPAAPSLASSPVEAPIINPTAPVQGAASTNPLVNQNPVNPVFQPSGRGISATDPIMMPEPAKAPDPVEEELNAPMKAAAPVPGSIGSAVSGPEGKAAGTDAMDDIFNASPVEQPRNVSFNDPATQPDAPKGMKTAKKTSKGTLIALIVVFVIIAGVLAVVLLGQIGVIDLGNLFGGSGNNGGGSTVAEVVVDEPVTPEPSTQGGGNVDTPTSKSTFLTCNRDMTETELLSYGDSLSGIIKIEAEFSNDKMISISLDKTVTYNIPDEITGQSITEKNEGTLKTTVDGITAENAANYYLTAGVDGKIDFSKEKIQANYVSLDFDCQSL